MTRFTDTEGVNKIIVDTNKGNWKDAIPEDKDEKWALSHPVDMVERYVSAITHEIQEYMSHKSTLEMGYKKPDATIRLIHKNAMRLAEVKFAQTKRDLFEYVENINKLPVPPTKISDSH